MHEKLDALCSGIQTSLTGSAPGRRALTPRRHAGCGVPVSMVSATWRSQVPGSRSDTARSNCRWRRPKAKWSRTPSMPTRVRGRCRQQGRRTGRHGLNRTRETTRGPRTILHQAERKCLSTRRGPGGQAGRRVGSSAACRPGLDRVPQGNPRFAAGSPPPASALRRGAARAGQAMRGHRPEHPDMTDVLCANPETVAVGDPSSVATQERGIPAVCRDVPGRCTPEG